MDIKWTREDRWTSSRPVVAVANVEYALKGNIGHQGTFGEASGTLQK